ncbi:AmmeMemoRadiSam system protein B [Tepidamorphus sp. 3E244]|uniref:AmmeMemoRadiSam system protein B n=1 Tax=Tepidamorphus sp. 3E244 TaxID=3385498 RepID=UPI0038FD2810
MRPLLSIVTGLVLMLGCAPPSVAEPVSPFVAAAFDREKIESAIASQEGIASPQGVTGIIVPHHLVAADLVARGFQAASGGDYERIVVLAPDHFRAWDKGFVTSEAGFATIFGRVVSDGVVAKSMAEALPDVRLRDSLEHDHGLVAMMPFIRHHFPDVPVVAMLAGINTTPQQWRALVDALKPLLTPRTLVVQSVDFSHYLPHQRAVLRDQEVLSLLASGDSEGVRHLIQPDHLDTKAGLTIQMTLQREVFGSKATVIANRNSAEYGGDPNNTTSYITAVYVRDPEAASELEAPDQHIAYIGGDVLLGRYMTPLMLDDAARTEVASRLLQVTRGRPLAINLEGVIMEEPVAGLPEDAHLMLRELAVPMLKAMGVTAASVANNHARDLGEIGFEETLRILDEAGIAVIEHGKVADLGAARILALNDKAGRNSAPALLDSPQAADLACGVSAAPPLVAFIHWGEEYVDQPGPREEEIARVLADCGVQIVVGAHSHQASGSIPQVPGKTANTVYSVGNLLFDQRGERVSSALLELRTFEQGTVAARLIPLPNLFDYGSARIAPPAN